MTSYLSIRRHTVALSAMALAFALTGNAPAVELQYAAGTQLVVIADVNLSPGPDSTVGDATSAATGLLMGGVMDNFTFGNAGITSSVPVSTNAFTVMRTVLTASGESFNAGPFSSTASINTGSGTDPFSTGAWTIDVLPSAGETAGTLVQIDVSASISGTANSFGDNLASSASWSVTTDNGIVMSGSANASNGSTAPISDTGADTFFVPLGGSFTLDIDISVQASGDSDGPSMGGDSSAFISAATVDVSATLLDTDLLIFPVAQTRRITGFAFADDENGNSDSDSDSAEPLDFGPFNAGAAAQAEVPEALGTGGGTQDSEILDEAINLSGSAFATGESFEFLGFADGSGSSTADIDFLLTAESDYALQGQINAFDSGLAELSLRDSGVEIFGVIASGPAEQINVDESGTLSAGSYTLLCRAEGSAFGSGFGSEFAFAEFFEVAFQLVPTSCQRTCGDLNGDGNSDLRDFAAFTRCFGNNPASSHDCRCADLDANGSIDLDDHAIFVNLIGAGSANKPPNCP